MAVTIGISIINYKTAELTINCLDSVLNDIGTWPIRIAVVDNASGDGSIEAIENWIAERPDAPVTVIKSETNTGFSGGHNIGMDALETDYYLILNSDAVVQPGFTDGLYAAVDNNPDAGLIAPSIQTEDGDTQISHFRFHSPASELIRAAQTGFVTRALSRFNVPLDKSEPRDRADWASFACIPLQSNMAERIGPMDEGYFLYYEDAEYSWRARQAKWQLSFAPQSVITHYRGGSGPVKTLEKAKKRLPAYFYASRTRYFRQTYGPLGPLAANLCWHVGRSITQLRRLIGKPVAPINALQWRDIWINFFNPMGPRRAPHET